MEEKTEQVELECLEWIKEIIEKGKFILSSIENKQEISDVHDEFLRFLHDKWYLGEFPLYKNISDLPCQSVMQIPIFSDMIVVTGSKKSNGMKLDIKYIELKRNKNEFNKKKQQRISKII